MPIQLGTAQRRDLLDVLDRITGWQTKAATLLDGEYTRYYVGLVAKGSRHNDKIMETLLQMAEAHREKERDAADRIAKLSCP